MITEIARITKVEPREGHWLRLWFADGAVKDVDVGPILWGPVFEAIRSDRRIFDAVRVDEELGTIAWPGDVDLDPDVLYGPHEPASGIRLERREVRRPDVSPA
jgi:hypothetical protein